VNATPEPSGESDQPHYHLLAELPWENPDDAPPELAELAAKAMGTTARRAPVTAGAIGFHSQISELPAGYEIPPHSHSAAELMIVLAGGAQVMDGPALTAGDVTEIPGGVEYGFVAGDEGIRFMVVRPEAAVTNIS